jgi:hypothetical protein
MKYKIVRIEPKRKKNGTKFWNVSFVEDKLDRVKEKRRPYANGSYLYPAYMKDEIAFNKLKACMISEHKKRIKPLEKSLKKLEELKYEYKTHER